MMDNDIKTWAQGYFVDSRKYKNLSEKDKMRLNATEHCMVRPAPTENAICSCSDPADAKWIASRLNLASVLEQMSYDFATGKTDGREIVKLVRDAVS